MGIKKIEKIVTPPPVNFVGDGFRVHNFIPSSSGMGIERMDPFILMDYNSKFYFPPSNTPKGVGVHPHKGFETVTIAYKGKIAHHDSAGGGGIIGEGDVQWMTASSGILHKEYHEKEFSKTGGDFQMVQLWVNLPAQYKLSPPKYQAISNSNMGNYYLPNNSGKVEVIAGEYEGISGPASTFTPVNMFNAKLNRNGSANFSFPKHFNTLLVVIEGNVLVNNEAIALDHLALFENNGEEFTIKAKEDAVVLILSGEPLNEPIAVHGPFAMNSREELVKAYQEYNNGAFGELED